LKDRVPNGKWTVGIARPPSAIAISEEKKAAWNADNPLVGGAVSAVPGPAWQTRSDRVVRRRTKTHVNRVVQPTIKTRSGRVVRPTRMTPGAA